jgi:hypothetical protein
VDYISGTLLASYAYDGNSHRTVKVVDGGRTFYLYGTGSKMISVFDDAASNTYTSGTTPGSAVDDYYATLLYQHKDKLTTRLTTDNSGVVASYQGHFPFGETWYEGGTADPSQQQRFSTFMKDYETASAQLHYAMSEFYSARNGEFQTLAPGRPGVAQPVSPYANIDPVNSPPDTGSSGTNPNTPQYAIMTDGGGPEAGACLDPNDPASCGGDGFGSLPLLKSSDQFASITAGLQGLLMTLTMQPDKTTGFFTPDQFTQMANAILAFENPGSMVANISYLPAAPPDSIAVNVDPNTSPDGLVDIMSDVTLQLQAAVTAWETLLLQWETTVFQKAPQGPLGSQSPTSTISSCSLQLQQGPNCSYSCYAAGAFGTYSATVSAITTACQATNTGQCPFQISVKGLNLSTTKVASCSM